MILAPRALPFFKGVGARRCHLPRVPGGRSRIAAWSSCLPQTKPPPLIRPCSAASPQASPCSGVLLQAGRLPMGLTSSQRRGEEGAARPPACSNEPPEVVVFCLSALSASSRTNAGAAERATGGAGAYDPERPQLGVGWLKARQLPPAPLLSLRSTTPPRDYGVWPCSSRGHDPTAAGVDCGRRQPRSCGERGDQSPPAVLGERVARERVPSEGGADRGDLRGAPQLRVAWRNHRSAPPCVVAACGNRTRSGSGFFHDQKGRLISVLVSKATTRSVLRPESHAQPSSWHGALQRRRLRGHAFRRLEPEKEPCHPIIRGLPTRHHLPSIDAG
jgi:hypothetical protein